MMLYVTHLYYMPAHHAHLFTHEAERGVTHCTDYMPWKELPLVGLASVEETAERQLSVPIYTQQVKATLCHRADLRTSEVYAFRLRTADGRYFLLGDARRPHPLASQTLLMSGRTSDVSAWSLSIKQSSPLPLMEIVG